MLQKLITETTDNGSPQSHVCPARDQRRNWEKYGDKTVPSYCPVSTIFVVSTKRSGYCRNLGSLRAGTRHHGDFSVMGNFFPSTFPEVLLAHASQMTGQLSQSMQIRRARDSINAMLATIISESDTEHRKLRSSEHGVYRDVSFPLSGNRGYDSNRSVPLSSCHETSRRFLRYGNDIKSRRERGYEALPQNTADRIRT